MSTADTMREAITRHQQLTRLKPIERLTYESQTVRLMMKASMVHMHDLTEKISNDHPLADQIEMLEAILAATEEKIIQLDITCVEVEEQA